MKLKRYLILPVMALATLSMGAVKGDFALVRDVEIMTNMMRALNENYVDSLSSDQLLKDATGGMSRSLDPYTVYMSEDEMGDFEVMTTGKYGGIGAVIRQAGDWVAVAQPYEGSPADKAGLRIGDRFVEIDGKSAKGMTTKDVSDRLKGTPSSNIKVVMRSVIDSAERKVTLRRERIKIPSVPYYGMLNDSVAYLKHTDFIDGCYEEIRAALDDLRGQGMKSVVLDYRSNGGGVMQEAIKVLSLFLPKGSEVLTVKGRADSMVYKTANNPYYLDLPVVALVDGNSASASEIVVGALQDMDRAVLIGQRSFGKGLVQSTMPVGYNSYVKLTTARYYIPSGRCIQEVDYTDHSESRKTHKVADSLRREFRTAGGRKVMDGGGVKPDVEMEAKYVSRFAATLYAGGDIEEWGEEYYRRHYQEDVDLDTFEFTDDDFASFKEFIKGRDIKYESRVSIVLKQLESAAKDDRNDELKGQIEAMKKNLHDDVESNLDRYRDEILSYMKSDYLLRRFYASGVLRNSILNDDEVAKAVEIVSDKSRMEKILAGEEE